MVSNSSYENITIFHGRGLSVLLSLLTQIKINLDMIGLKGIFCVSKDPFSTHRQKERRRKRMVTIKLFGKLMQEAAKMRINLK